MSDVEETSAIWSRLPQEQRAARVERSPSPARALRSRRDETEAGQRGKVAEGASMWDLALTFWPLDDRPEPMKCKATVNNMSLNDIFNLQARCELLSQREGKGSDSFGRDRKLPDKMYEQQVDNCSDKLHAVR
jgi:hypothetical protein